MKRTLSCGGLVWLVCLGPVAWGQPANPTPPRLSIRAVSDQSVRLAWSKDAAGFLLEATDQLSATPVWQSVALLPQVEGDEFAVTVVAGNTTRFFRLREPPLTTISQSSPADGETGVAVTRETIVHFSLPLSASAVLTTNNFYATFGGRRILSRIELSTDRRTATLFYPVERLPGSARINVFFDSEGLADFLGRPLDPSGSGKAGGFKVIQFDTLSLTPLAGTAVIGRVFASELQPGPDTGTNAVNRPLEGVTITLDGAEQDIRTQTDAMGNFKLEPVPPGRFFVKIDGRTVTNLAENIRYPDLAYYPYVGKAWDAVAGRTDNKAGGTGEIYLPLIKPGTLQKVSMEKDTTITFPPEVVAANPALAGVSITVPANSLFADDGARGGYVGIAPVPPDRLPGPLPPGLEMPLVITVQTDGALNFDKPAPICFPNLPDPVTKQPSAPGTKRALISFNHKKGIWEAAGKMTVSADGKFVCTDPGSGILQPGWHGDGPDPDDPDPCEDDCCDNGPGPGPQSSGWQPPRVSPHHAMRSRDGSAIQLAGGGGEPVCRDPCGIPPYAPCPCTDPLGCDDDPPCPNPPCEDPCPRNCSSQIVTLAIKIPVTELACHAVFHFPPLCTLITIYEIYHLVHEIITCEDNCHRPNPRPSLQSHASHQAAAIPPLGSVVESLDPVIRQIYDLVLPFARSGQPIPANVRNQLAALYDQANAIAGGDAVSYLQKRRAELEASATVHRPETFTGNAPAYPVKYLAQVNRPTGLFSLRGETEPFGQYKLFVPQDGILLDVSFYDERTKSFAIVYRFQRDLPHSLPRFYLRPIDKSFADTDGDGLVDMVERIYGTDGAKRDSDGDGVPDGAEVEQGTNPLDGLPAQTGIIATAKTPGPAVDVCAVNDLAIVAEGTSGVSVFNVFNGMNPIIIAQVDTPGNALRVACSGSLIAVADEGAGLAVIDISDPTNARVSRQIGVGTPAMAVAAGAGVAYVGTSAGLVVAVDMTSGAVLNRVALSSGVEDLALAGDYLYALTADRLAAISIARGALNVTGVADSPVVVLKNRRVFVGGGLAYATHPKGYNTFDLADPAKPVLIKASNTTQFGWKQIVANGSGLGLAAVGLNLNEDPPNDVWLFDVRDANQTDLFLTAFPTPGTARAVSIFNGLAYVADDTAGLQVINYLAYDAKGQPPTISLATDFRNNLVEQGKPVRATATVTDDVQVRNVEFHLDGQKALTDGNFPFEFRFLAPAYSSMKTSFRVRARAVDTGGNATWSDELEIALADDLTSPQITRATPWGGDNTVTALFAYFDEPLSPASVTAASLQLSSAGADEAFGTADDAAVLGGTVSYRSDITAAAMNFSSPLPPGRYRAVVTTAIMDPATNHLGQDYSWEFRVGDAVYWTRTDSGPWHDAASWNTGQVPGTNDDVVIDVPGDAVISFSQGTNAVKSVYSRNTLELSGGQFTVNGPVQLGGDLILSGGGLPGGFHGSGVTLVGASISSFSASNHIVLRGANTVVFNGVSLGMPFDLEAGSRTITRVIARNGLTLNSRITLARSGGDYVALEFDGTQIFGGNGQVVFLSATGGDTVQPINGTLTIGAGITIRGNSGTVGNSALPLINQGTIRAETPVSFGGTGILIKGSPVQNDGALESASGGSLSVENLLNHGAVAGSSGGSVSMNGAWKNSGVIAVTDASVNFGGEFAGGDMGTIQGRNGTVNFTGALNNAGSTLALDGAIASWRLAGGRINGGVVLAVNGGSLVAQSGTLSTLEGVTLNSDMTVEPGGRVVAVNGLTLNGTLTLDERSGAYTALEFSGAQTLDGSGQVVLPGFNQSGQVRPVSGTLTIGPDITIHGRAGTVGNETLPLVNQGRIIADTPLGGFGRGILVVGKDLENRGTVGATSEGLAFLRNLKNTGTVSASSKGSVVIDGNWTNGGVLTIDDASLSLGGTFTVGTLGAVQRTGGTVVLSGVLDNTGTTLNLDASTGSWRIEDGRINGGTVTATEGASLVVSGGRAATLDGVTLNSDVMVEAGGRVVAVNGLTLNGALTLDERSGAYTALEFSDAQTLAGSGQVVFTGLNPSGTVQPTSGTLTIGAGITIRGGTGTLGNRNLPLVNEGTISADVAGRTIFVLANPFTNNGTIQKLNGGKVLVNP